jgi:glycopeptide antibiotics resistance protein
MTRRFSARYDIIVFIPFLFILQKCAQNVHCLKKTAAKADYVCLKNSLSTGYTCPSLIF